MTSENLELRIAEAKRKFEARIPLEKSELKLLLLHFIVSKSTRKEQGYR